MEEVKTSGLVSEKLYKKTLPDGLKCYIIPRKGFVEKQALIAVHFGSVHDRFADDSGHLITLPDGCAHFLEHEMFEKPQGNALQTFSALGAEVNAFTSHMVTGYYTSCVDRFNACLDALFDLVYTPCFTGENVAGEAAVIKQEISMYDDDPGSRALLNLLDCLYTISPIRKNIAGSHESVSRIDKDMLYACHSAFYTPDNMALICVGDFSKSEIYEIARSHEKKSKSAKKEFLKEPDFIRKPCSHVKMEVSPPFFAMGFKDIDEPVCYKKVVEVKLLLDILFGESSEFFTSLYADGLLDDFFGTDVLDGQRDSLSVLLGRSKNPGKVVEKALEAIGEAKMHGISQDRIKIIKNKHLGRMVRGFNALDQIALASAGYFANGVDIFEVFDFYERVRPDDLEDRLSSHFAEERFAVSVVSDDAAAIEKE